MAPLKLIAIDLDETLLRRDKTYEVARFNQVLKELRSQSVLVAIVTGNSYDKVKDYFEASIRPFLYFACDNGNYLVQNEVTLKKIGIPYERFIEIIDFIDEFKGYYPALCLGDATYERESKGVGHEILAQFNPRVQRVDSFRELPEDSLVTKIAILSQDDLDRNKALVRIINERYEDVTAVTSAENWVDIYNCQGGKGSAIRFLKERYQLKAEDCLAMGDSLNDESMMKEVHYSVAMENADKDLVMQCRYQIGNNNDQAVVQLMEDYQQTGSLDFMQKYRTIKI